MLNRHRAAGAHVASEVLIDFNGPPTARGGRLSNLQGQSPGIIYDNVWARSALPENPEHLTVWQPTATVHGLGAEAPTAA